MRKLAFLSFLAFTVLVGCNRPAVSTLPYEQMGNRDFVAVVNGVGYTKGELERDVAITEKLLGLSGIPSDEMVSRKEPQAFRRSVVSGFVAREVLLNEAERRHVELTPADMADFQDRFADDLPGRMPISFNALLDALGKDATAFRNNLKKDALSAKVEAILKQQIAAAIPSPTPDELARARQDAVAANRRAEADNRALFRLATNAWRSIRAGNDFAIVAKKLPSLHKGIAYDADYRAAADRFQDLASGTLTAPVATDGGLEIAKVSVAADGTRHVSRLFFRPTGVEPLPSDKALAGALERKNINARYAALLKELKETVEISTCGSL